MQLTYHYRVKDKYAAELSRQARAVNFVWNYCNEVQQKAVRDGRKWLNYSDLARLTAGSGQACGCMAGPEGRAGLNKRMWRCDGCGSVHDRDVNAARNILRLGLQALAAGAPVVVAGNPGLQAGE